ncbi:4246_t:CDS:1 [Scutellospora calospora]|uniref:4246_t:CDS:1 n=1 Tax=Scutellospora calospora TaxID=85575 RepID=A0ACA9MLB6_9GLOM|nr:4246_t:CDS:1 [Scutellospora calospora]
MRSQYNITRLLFILLLIILAIYLFRQSEFKRINFNLKQIQLDKKIAEKHRNLEDNAIKLTRQKIEEYIYEYQNFTKIIPGSNRIIDIESLIKFRNYLECVTTKGNWALDLTPRPLIRHKQSPLYGKCNKRYKNNGGNQIISVKEEWKLIPEFAKYVWKTPNECPMQKMDVKQACNLISGLRFLLVGDELQYQLHELLLDFFHEGPVQCYGEISCKMHTLCGIDLYDQKTSAMRYIRSDILSVEDPPYLMDIKYLQFPWLKFIKNYSIIILNKGHHWQDDEIFRDNLISTIITLRKQFDDRLIIYRATIIGHLNCQNADKPLPSPPNSTELENLPYHWGDIHRQNLIAKEIVEAFGGVFLDIEPAMITRADGHIGGRDCLRWCIPGPADVWLDFLFYVLQELI